MISPNESRAELLRAERWQDVGVAIGKLRAACLEGNGAGMLDAITDIECKVMRMRLRGDDEDVLMHQLRAVRDCVGDGLHRQYAGLVLMMILAAEAICERMECD